MTKKNNINRFEYSFVTSELRKGEHWFRRMELQETHCGFNNAKEAANWIVVFIDSYEDPRDKFNDDIAYPLFILDTETKEITEFTMCFKTRRTGFLEQIA